MKSVLSLFNLYTNLVQVNQLSYREGVRVVFDLKLEDAIEKLPPSSHDVLIIETCDVSHFSHFPGLIITRLEANASPETTSQSEHRITLSNGDFLKSITLILDARYRLYKCYNERNELIKQLDMAASNKSQQTPDQAPAKNEQNDQLAMLNHELKTPLNVIAGHASLLMETELSKTQQLYLTRIQKASKMLQESLDEILYYDDMLAGLSEVNISVFNFEEALKDMHLVFKSFAAEKDIDYEVHYDQNISHALNGDIHKIELLIKQLINNALKFTKEGYVRFSVGCVQDNNLDQLLAISVEDSGVGFEMDQVDELLLPFKQGEHYLQREYGGLGLGLTIVKGILESLNGSMDIESRVGAGSKFTIKLSLSKVTTSVTASGKAPCILVVDDNALNRKLLKEMFEEEGICVELARNGKEAVEIVKEKTLKIDLVLMDLIMPVMDGFEATQHIRQIDSKLPIVIISASISAPEVKKMKHMKIDDFVIKNHRVEDYLKVIRRYIRIPEKENSGVRSEELIETLKKQQFSIINIEELFQRYNYKTRLIYKIADGLNNQLEQFETNWNRLLIDLHDEEAKRYMHSIKGLVRSVGDDTLGNQIHEIEINMNVEDFTPRNFENIKRRIQALQIELKQIAELTNVSIRENSVEKRASASGESLADMLRTLLQHLQVHDVKQIREKIEAIRASEQRENYDHAIDELMALIDRYQYEQAEEWVQRWFEQRGEETCSI